MAARVPSVKPTTHLTSLRHQFLFFLPSCQLFCQRTVNYTLQPQETVLYTFFILYIILLYQCAMASGPSRAPPYLFAPRTSLQVPGRSSSTNSPWSGSDGGDLMDDLTLPPINPYSDAENNFDLPPFVNNPRFFGLETGASSPNPFASNNLTSAPPQDTEQASEPEPEPPPSNQQQNSRPRPRRGSFTEHYRLSSSPDPYGSFIDLDDLQGLDDLEGFSEVEQSEGTTSQMPAETRTAAARRASIVDLTSSPTQERPPKRKRDTASTSDGEPKKVARATIISPPRNRASVPPKVEADVEVVDLAEIENDEQYQDLHAKEAAELSKKQALDEATRPVKLAHFNCIICMDQPTDLTVTHCGMYPLSKVKRVLLTFQGHMFCSECLHQALYAGDKKCCPVCRSAITVPSARDRKPPSKGIFALEMKLMTRNRKGKQPMRT
jgi:hypothetical protein